MPEAAHLPVEPRTIGKRWPLTLRILAGPTAFLAVYLIPTEGLELEPHIALGCYAWILAWWATTPIPWAVTGFLPLLLFPLGNVMPFREASALYGQRIFPFVLGVMLFGHAFRKHGLAKRLALRVLRVRGVAKSGSRLVLMFLVVTAVLSTLVDDAAAVAIMIPIAVSVAGFASSAQATPFHSSGETPRVLTASCLAVLYGSAAGGLATPAGVPFNPLSISILEQLTDYQISFAQWSLTGALLMASTLPVYYLVLNGMLRPGGQPITDGGDYFKEETEPLGPMSRGEKNVLFVLIVMVVLWFLPAFVAIDLLDIWYVPSVAMVLLFLLPVNARTGEMTLGGLDFQEGVLWNVLFLVVGGTAVASGMVQVGITSWLGGMLTGTVSASALPWVAGSATPILSHLTSGTATTSMVSTILFPVANQLGYNSAVLARIIAGTALAVSVPWAGAASATAFASGAIRFGTMIKVGALATVLTVIVVTLLSIVLIPALGAFTRS